METISKVLRNGQFTVPTKFRNSLNIKEGDYIKVELDEDHIIITPVQVIDKDQAYIFSSKWQKMIGASLNDYKEGRYESVSSVDALMKGLGKKNVRIAERKVKKK